MALLITTILKQFWEKNILAHKVQSQGKVRVQIWRNVCSPSCAIYNVLSKVTEERWSVQNSCMLLCTVEINAVSRKKRSCQATRRLWVCFWLSPQQNKASWRKACIVSQCVNVFLSKDMSTTIPLLKQDEWWYDTLQCQSILRFDK